MKVNKLTKNQILNSFQLKDSKQVIMPFLEEIEKHDYNLEIFNIRK